jgi:hypothetical protein
MLPEISSAHPGFFAKVDASGRGPKITKALIFKAAKVGSQGNANEEDATVKVHRPLL